MSSKARKSKNFISMACTSASVCFRESLTPDELVQAMASGIAPRNRHAHFRLLLEEAPEALLRGLVEQLSTTFDRISILQNVFKIAGEVDTLDRIQKILGAQE